MFNAVMREADHKPGESCAGFAALSGYLDRLYRGPRKNHRLHSADYFNTQAAVQNLDLQLSDNSQMERKR